MGRKILLFFILIFMLGTSSVFASDWDFSYEKEVYYKSADLMKNISGDYTGKIKNDFLESTFIEHLFLSLETYFETETNYDQEDYPFLILYFYRDNQIKYCLKKSNQSNFIVSNSTGFAYSLYGNIDLSSDNIITSISSYINNSSSDYYSADFYYNGGAYPSGIYLSDYNGTYTVGTSFPVLNSVALYEYYPSTSIALGVNQYGPSNNFILNKEFKIGFDYDFSYNFYYLDGNEKVSINDYITLNISNFWYGTQYSPYVLKENISNLPANTDFYLDLSITAKGGSSFSKTLVENQKVFYTFYDENKGEIESGDVGGGTNPSGDTGGGTPDYTEQLGNINNNISSSTNQIIENQNQNQAQTNEKLDNITNFLSGDITKTPEELEENLNIEIEIEDPTADFFTWFFNQIVECFNVNSNQILNFSILDKNFSINTDDYIFDIPILKNVIGIGSSIFIFYGIFQDIRREIEKIKEGKFEAIASEDITANMM